MVISSLNHYLLTTLWLNCLCSAIFLCSERHATIAQRQLAELLIFGPRFNAQYYQIRQTFHPVPYVHLVLLSRSLLVYKAVLGTKVPSTYIHTYIHVYKLTCVHTLHTYIHTYIHKQFLLHTFIVLHTQSKEVIHLIID